jgi:predicted dehydrogenase
MMKNVNKMLMKRTDFSPFFVYDVIDNHVFKGESVLGKHLKIGIIGAGGMAGAHLKSYLKMDDVTIVAVADPVPGKAKEFIDRSGLKDAVAFEDHQKLLELDLDGVSICTPNVAHHNTSVDALNAGKHVLVEKPMSVTLEQGVDMVLASKKASKILTIGFQPRYDPNMKEIKKIVQSGILGDIYYVQTGDGRRRGIPGRPSFVSKEIAGVGALADIGCYSLDMALNSLGYPKPVTVSAYTSDKFGKNPEYCSNADMFDVEDFAAALIRFENGLVMNFKISWAMHMDTLGPSMFLGTKSGLKVAPAKGPNLGYNGVWDGGVGSIELFHDVLGHQTQSQFPVKNHQVEIFYQKVRDFVTAIQEGKSAPIPGEEILINQAIIDGMIRSASIGREVEIHIPNI